MIFSDLYKSPRSPFSKLRTAHAVAPPSDLDADLVSKDKNRQKEAVKRFLAEKVRNDWEFSWPSVVTSPATATSAVAAQPADGAVPPPAPGPTALASGDATQLSGPDAAAAAPAQDGQDAPRDPGEEADSESDAESVYSTISEDLEHYRPRAEWTSDLSDSDEPKHAAFPFHFDSPDAVGAAVKSSLQAKRDRRRRAVREESLWNPGLACFEARRNAWTGARTVRVKPKPAPPTSPSSPRRLFWRHHRTESSASAQNGVMSGSPPALTSPLSPTATRSSQQTDMAAITPPPSEPGSLKSSNGTAATTPNPDVQRTSSHTSASSSTAAPNHTLYPVETLLPLPAPLLPAQNPMRASINPSMYTSLYDKIVVQSLQPSCPVNLADMLRACVVGWKRDGEWPPKPAYSMPVAAPMAVAAANAEYVAYRHQRKLQQQQQLNAARRSNAATSATSPTSPSTSRRMSFGFLSGGTKHEDTKDAAGKDSPGSDEGAGRTIRRSLQKVFSLGSHSMHVHPGPMSPTSPSRAPEVTAYVLT